MATIYNGERPADRPGCATSGGARGGSIAKSNRLCQSWADSATLDVEGKLAPAQCPIVFFPAVSAMLPECSETQWVMVLRSRSDSLPVWWVRVLAEVKWRVYNSFCVLALTVAHVRDLFRQVCAWRFRLKWSSPSPSASLFRSESNTKVCECFQILFSRDGQELPEITDEEWKPEWLALFGVESVIV